MTHRDWKTIFECEAVIFPFLVLLIWVMAWRGKKNNPQNRQAGGETMSEKIREIAEKLTAMTDHIDCSKECGFHNQQALAADWLQLTAPLGGKFALLESHRSTHGDNSDPIQIPVSAFDALLQEVRNLTAEREDYKEEIDSLIEQVCGEAQIVGYYGGDIDDALTCFRSAIQQTDRIVSDLESEVDSLTEQLRVSESAREQQGREISISNELAPAICGYRFRDFPCVCNLTFGHTGDHAAKLGPAPVDGHQEIARTDHDTWNRVIEEVAKAEHSPGCDFEWRTIHNEPCPFWKLKYCLVDPCAHGIAMKDHCSHCGPSSGATLPSGWAPCGPAPCNCWKSRILALVPPLAEHAKIGGVAEHPDTTIDGVALIAAERKRQIGAEGWSADHDRDEHPNYELSKAAICYARAAHYGTIYEQGDWPWDSSWWKPSEDPVRNLVKAGALIAAEIDRLKAYKKAIDAARAGEKP